MRMRIRLVSLMLLVCFFLSLTPTQAAILPIEPRNPPIKVLGDDETKLITNLISGQVYTVFLSSVSPNDSYVQVAFAGLAGSARLGVLNLKDGTFRPTPNSVLQNRLFSTTSTRAWLDDRTVTYFTVNEKRETVQVTYDVVSDELKSKPVRFPGSLFSLAPNGSRAIFLVPPSRVSTLNEATGESDELTLDQIFDVEVKLSFDAPSKPRNFDGHQYAGQNTLRVASNAFQVVSLDLTSGQVSPLYEFAAGVAQPFDLAWSKDGTKFAMNRQIFPDIGREGNLLLDLASLDGMGQLPPQKNPFYLGNYVDVVDFSGATPVAKPEFLKSSTQGNGDIFFGLSWSPDGKTLLTKMNKPSRFAKRPYPSYIAQFNESSYLRFYNIDGQLLNTFESPEINAPLTNTPFFVSPDEVLIAAVRGTDFATFYYNRATGEFRRLPIQAGSINNGVATNQSRQFLFTHSSFARPNELYAIGFDGSNLQRVTNNNPELTNLGKVQVNEVSFTLSKGQERKGYLIQPSGQAFPPRDVPIVMWQEGGPDSPYLNRWSADVEAPFNLLPQFGISVLFVPFPGREGFGPDFLKGLSEDENFGQIDIDEGAEVMRQTISRGWTAQNKVGITGCSYGGYFTSQSMTRYPDLYAAGNTQCTLLDLFNEWQFGFTPFIFKLEGRSPTTDPAEYQKDSPLYNANKIKGALLIFHGTADFLPIQIAANFHDQIQNNGSPVNFYAFNRQGHGLSSISAQISAAQVQVQWFKQYLAPAAR